MVALKSSRRFLTMKIDSSRHLATPGMLDGIRVLDFSAVISGPYCTRMLADLGADIIKVEPPDGELLRHAPPFRSNQGGEQVSTLFAPLNAGKRCISLDLKRPEAKSIIFELVKRSDVVMENFAPGVMARLGFDYETLKTHNESLIMCSISGYGQSGPMSKRPAYAPIVHAWSGFDLTLLDAQTVKDKPLNMGPPVADTTASQQAFGAICAALFYRERSGVGQYIDISMYDALIATLHKDLQQAQQPLDNDRFYGPLRTQDGWIVIMVLSDRHFGAIASAMDRPALASDARFASSAARFDNYNELMSLVEQWTMQHATSTVDERFTQAGVPCSPYRSLTETLDDPQLHQRDMLVAVEDSAGPVTVANSAMLFSDTPASVPKWVADIGEHNREVFVKELGLAEEQLKTLGLDAES